MKLIPTSLSRVVAGKGLLLQEHSPSLLFGVGVVSMVGSTVLACRATLKLEGVLDTAEKDVKQAKVTRESDPDRYSEDEMLSDLRLIKFRTVRDIGILYAPAVVLNVMGISALTQSHRILTKRNAALAAAYTAVDRAFREYRERVVDKYGEDQDRHFRYGTEEVIVHNEKTGKDKTVLRVASELPSQYAKFFDQYCAPWSKDPEVNLIWLRAQQNYLNELLVSRGHVFLNEAYTALGMPHTQAGSVVGWRLADDGVSDNYIDFGIFKGENNAAIDFVNGREGAILLDFNVDGLIFDKIDTPTDRLSWQN